MRADWSHLEDRRKLKQPLASKPGDKFGAFYFKRGTRELIIIASSGDDTMPWEHVSARVEEYRGGRCPTWDEMCFVKDLFWDPEEAVVQFHPPQSQYVNNHPHVLHLWKPIGLQLLLPPSIAVGILSR